MKTLKSLVLIGALAFSAQGFAQTAVCDGTAAKKVVNGGGGAVTPSTTGFLQSGFDLQCSNNVLLSYEENSSTKVTVGATSTKGNQYFGGNSNGGAIKALGKCAADPCGSADITSALTAGAS